MALTPSNSSRDPHANEVFVREVDDELRRDQMVEFWRRWGRTLIAGIGAALALFGGWLLWQNHREKAAGQEGEQLTAAYEALSGGRIDDAERTLAPIAGSSRDGFRAMAEFSQADLLLRARKQSEAAAKFAAIAADGSLAKPFRDLALIRQTAAEYDQLKPSVIVERLRPLAQPGSAWLGSAGEMLAGAYLAEGRRDLAATLFGQIAQGDDVPATLRQRSVQMASAMSAGAGSTAAAGAGTNAPAGGAKAE